MCQENHNLPCLHCQPNSYIRVVQHLIERCLLLHMSRDDCIMTLKKHANIDPIVTLTVWKELLKENEGFFEAYSHVTSQSNFSEKSAGGCKIEEIFGSKSETSPSSSCNR